MKNPYNYSSINQNDVITDDGDGIKGKKYHLYYGFQVFFVLYLIIMQSMCFIYIYEISLAAKEIDVYTINQTETREYIKKLENIINYICDNEDIC